MLSRVAAEISASAGRKERRTRGSFRGDSDRCPNREQTTRTQITEPVAAPAGTPPSDDERDRRRRASLKTSLADRQRPRKVRAPDAGRRLSHVTNCGLFAVSALRGKWVAVRAFSAVQTFHPRFSRNLSAALKLLSHKGQSAADLRAKRSLYVVNCFGNEVTTYLLFDRRNT